MKSDCAWPIVPRTRPRTSRPQSNRFMAEALPLDSETWTPAASVITSSGQVKQKMKIWRPVTLNGPSRWVGQQSLGPATESSHRPPVPPPRPSDQSERGDAEKHEGRGFGGGCGCSNKAVKGTRIILVFSYDLTCVV